MDCNTIMAIRAKNRMVEAHAIQDVLTEYGCLVRVRLGLHDAGLECTNEGLILLHLCGEKIDLKFMEDALNTIEGVKAVSMDI